MDADYDIFEIAFVIGGYKLIDGESYERQYWRMDERPLPRGYYVVYWPKSVRVRRFNEYALFHGPFICRPEAYVVLKRLRAVSEEAVLALADI